MDAMDLGAADAASGFHAPAISEHETHTADDWDVPAPAQDGFDYDLIGDPVVRQEAIEAAERIKGRLRKSLEEYVGIGFDLIKVKDGIGYGNFQRWIDAEFGMTYKTATNYINVATRFGKPEIISCLTSIPPTALIHLASAPEAVQEEILEAAASGQRIKVKDVNKAIAKAKSEFQDTEERSEERKLEAALKRIGTDIQREAKAVADERSAVISAAITEVVQIVFEIDEARFTDDRWKQFQKAGKAARKAVRLLIKACDSKIPDDIRQVYEAVKGIDDACFSYSDPNLRVGKRCADDLRKAILGDPDAWNVGVEPEVEVEHDDHGSVFDDFNPPESLKHLVDA